MSRKPKLSKRRLEVLASYGVFPEQPEEKIETPRPKGRPRKDKRKPYKLRKPKVVDTSLPKHSPIAIRRELELEGYDPDAAKLEARNQRQKTLNNNALKSKPRSKLTDEERLAHKRASEKRNRSQVNGIEMMGFLTAATAKALASTKSSINTETSAPYYNYQDNFIENQYHGKTSAFDPRHNDLIEIQECGKMIWHGDTCAVCTMPPSTIGEVMLAQYGEANFVCTDCGKLVETKGLGMRGWIFTQIQNIKRQKATQIKKYHLPKAEDDEELD